MHVHRQSLQPPTIAACGPPERWFPVKLLPTPPKDSAGMYVRCQRLQFSMRELRTKERPGVRL